MGQVIVSNLFSWRAFFVPKGSLMGKFLHDGRMSPKPHLLRNGEGGGVLVMQFQESVSSGTDLIWPIDTLTQSVNLDVLK